MKLSQRRMARPSLGGMLATRQGALVVALLCAACAAGVLMIALSSYKRNAQTVTPQATVLVATGEIQKGTSGDLVASEKRYKAMPILATQLSAGAISDASLLAGKVALADVLPGQQLTTSEFGAVTGVDSQLSPDQRAVSIQTNEVDGDLDVISPGDHIDVYAVLTSKSVPVVSLLASNVLVLKTPGSALAGAAPTTTTGTSAAAPSPTPASGSALVLALSDSLVPVLGYVAANGQVYVALRPTNATGPNAEGATEATVLAQAAIAVQPANSKTTTRKHP